MMDIGDHPVIRNMERYGTPDGRPEVVPTCPECGAECDTLYRNRYAEIIGCESCIDRVDALEVLSREE